MPHKKFKSAAPFDAFKPDVITTFDIGYMRCDIESDRHKSVIQMLYDATSVPNQMAFVRYNHQPNLEAKASKELLPNDANNCCFTVTHADVISQPFNQPGLFDKRGIESENGLFSKNATDLIASKVIPEMIVGMKNQMFISDLNEICLFPAYKQERYLDFMLNAAQQTGLAVEKTKVQTGALREIDGLIIKFR